MNHLPQPQRIALLTLLALAAACSSERREFHVESPRTVDRPPPRFGVGSAARFGFEDPDRPSNRFAYDLPSGWVERETSAQRLVNLTTPGGAEVWITVLSGDAGGLGPNLARWHQQMERAAPTPEETAALPRQPLLGAEALRVELTTPDGSRGFIALASFGGPRSVFVRMSGPNLAVAAQAGAFDAFVASLRETQGEAGGQRAAPPVARPAPTAPGGDGSVGTAAGFTFEVPAGWSPLPSKPMREAYHACGDGVEVWFTVLGGDGGGLLANVGRWAGQVGAAMPTPAELESLPRLEVLGAPSPWVDLTQHAGDQGMLALASMGVESSVFVKMIGPREAVRAREAQFRAFCESLARAEGGR